MSGGLPSHLVPYRDYRISHFPVHVNRTDFQSFVLQAVSAGWFPPGPQPVVALDIATDVFADQTPPSGILPGQSILVLLQDHYHRVCFSCDSGDYTFVLTYRQQDHVVVHVDLVHHLDAEGFISFGFALGEGVLVVSLYSNESTDPAAHAYVSVESLVDVTISSPLIPDSSYIGVHSVSYFVPFVVPVPGSE
jgi:hypothetical protein